MRLLQQFGPFGLTSLLIAVALVACGQPTGANGASAGNQPPAGSPVAIPTAPPVPSVRATAAPVDTSDPIVQEALRNLAQSATVRSGTPTVILSRQVSTDDLAQLRVATYRYEAGCTPDLRLIVIRGDFDVANLVHSPTLTSATPQLAQSVIYVYDARHTMLLTIRTDATGVLTRLVTGDPTLTPADIASLPAAAGEGSVYPCEPRTCPGMTYPTPTPR